MVGAAAVGGWGAFLRTPDGPLWRILPGSDFSVTSPACPATPHQLSVGGHLKGTPAVTQGEGNGHTG